MHNRHLFGLMASVSAITLLAPLAAAEEPVELNPVNPRPMTWEQIRDVVEEGYGDKETNIPANLEEAQCGGWDLEEHIPNAIGAAGYVAEVYGVPGRTGQPLGDIESGMAVKNSFFQYPSNPSVTCGFMSACRPLAANPYLNPDFYNDASYAPNGQSGPCQRPLGNGEEGKWVDEEYEESCDGKCCSESRCISQSQDASDALKYTCGGGDMEVAQNGTPVQFCQELTSKGLQGGLCYKLNNDWVYTLWAKPEFLEWPPGSGEYELIFWLMEKGNCRTFDSQFYDNGIDEGDEDADQQKEQEDPQPEAEKPSWWNNYYENKFSFLKGSATSIDSGINVDWEAWEYRPVDLRSRYCCTDQVRVNPYADGNPNCTTCTGTTCRTGTAVKRINALKWYCLGFGSTAPPATCTARNDDHVYASYYRRYIAGYERAQLDGVDDDVHKTEEPIAVSCYGVWDIDSRPGRSDFDPAIHRTPNGYKRCVIAAGYDDGTEYGDQEFYKRYETQEAGGEYQNSSRSFSEPNDPARKTYDEDTDLWNQEIGRAGGLSLLNPDKLREEYDNDLSFPLLNLDTARVRTGVPLDYEKTASGAIKNLFSSGFLLQSFDDSGQPRSVSTWWQEQLTMAHRVFTPPQLKLTLPAGWATGLDPTDPLFTPDLPYVNDPGWDENPYQQPLEVQLEMRPGLLGQVTEYLQKSLSFQFKEEKVPVVVPLASATELRAIAQGWCTWDMQRTGNTTCNSSDVQKLISAINDYIRQIENVRELRSQMPEIVRQYVEFNAGVQDALSEWLIVNQEEYNNYLLELESRLQLKGTWNAIVSEYIKFHDQSNQAWCRNDRFTLPIYTLLDPWFPFEQAAGASVTLRDLNGPELPRLEIERIPDVYLDFSHLSFSTGGTITIPVVDPIQVRLDMQLLAAPNLDAESVAVPELPNLPPIPKLTDYWSAPALPTTLSGADLWSGVVLPTVATYEPDIVADTSAISQIGTKVRGMRLEYDKFWKSILVKPDEIWDGTEEDCYLQNETTSYDDNDDESPGRCVHVEHDLVERFTRIAARPGIQLYEDLMQVNTGYVLPYQTDFNYCPPDDWACLQLNPQLTAPKMGWHVTNTGSLEQADTINNARLELLRRSLQLGTDPEDQVPYTVNRNLILPSFARPEDIDLFATGAVMSSTSSTPLLVPGLSSSSSSP